jgi:glutamate synthase (NADPH/NADH) large chain
MTITTMRHSPDRGLHDPASEHDSCGFGLIAQVEGSGSRAIVDIALEALVADGASRRRRRRRPVRRRLRRADPRRPALPAHAGGRSRHRPAPAASPPATCSCRTTTPRRCECRDTLQRELARVGLRVAGWRDVPVDPAACGQLARSSMPRIQQVFVESDEADTDAFERALFLARKRSEDALQRASGFPRGRAVAAVAGLQGHGPAGHLRQLFPDLSRPELEARAVVFHQRFSTNTLPRWPLAHPFRRLAHNGEINTIEGNRCWAKARKQVWRSPLLDVAEFEPVVSSTARIRRAWTTCWSAAAGRHGPAQGDAHPDAAGDPVAGIQGHRPRRVLRVLRDQFRAVGRPGRRRHLRRPPRRLHARPQRPAPGALDADLGPASS